MPDAIVVAGGSGRSGSTLIAEVVASATNRPMLGEVSQFWRLLDTGTPCACGEPVDRCEFWSGILCEVTTRDRLPAIVDQHDALVRALTRPYLRRPDVAIWRRAHIELVAAVGRATPAGYVDSSKQLTHLEVLAEEFADTTAYLHLTRDPRAVAHSWATSKPIEREGGRPMRTIGPVKSSIMWLTRNRPQRRLAASFAAHAHRRYESFCADPAGFVSALLSELGDDRPIDPGTLDDIGARRFVPRPSSHALAGNPAREGNTATTIRIDDRWVGQQSPWTSRLVRVVTAIEARHYRG